MCSKAFLYLLSDCSDSPRLAHKLVKCCLLLSVIGPMLLTSIVVYSTDSHIRINSGQRYDVMLCRTATSWGNDAFWIRAGMDQTVSANIAMLES